MTAWLNESNLDPTIAMHSSKTFAWKHQCRRNMWLCFVCSLALVFLDFPFIIIYQLISNSAASVTHRFSHLDFLTETSPTLFHTKYTDFFFFWLQNGIVFTPAIRSYVEAWGLFPHSYHIQHIWRWVTREFLLWGSGVSVWPLPGPPDSPLPGG